MIQGFYNGLGYLNMTYKENENGDRVYTFPFTQEYYEIKKRFGWKIADEDEYKAEKKACIDKRNKVIVDLQKYNIPYETWEEGFSGETIYGMLILHNKPSLYTDYRKSSYTYSVKFTITKERQPWFFELTCQLGYDQMLANLKAKAGIWYERVRNSEPAKKLATSVEIMINATVSLAYENSMKSIFLDSDFCSQYVQIYYYRPYTNTYPEEAVAYKLCFKDEGYQNMNDEQLAALMAVYIETGRNYCRSNQTIQDVKFHIGKVFETSYETRLKSYLYLAETKELKSW